MQPQMPSVFSAQLHQGWECLGKTTTNDPHLGQAEFLPTAMAALPKARRPLLSARCLVQTRPVASPTFLHLTEAQSGMVPAERPFQFSWIDPTAPTFKRTGPAGSAAGSCGSSSVKG